MNYLKTIFTKKEQNMLKYINSNSNISKSNEENKVIQKKNLQNSKQNKMENSNTLKTIIDSIISNLTIQKAIGIHNIMSSYKEHIQKTSRIPKICYKQILKKIGGEPDNKNVGELRRSIIKHLPPNPNIENIIDSEYKIKKIKNKQDRESVVYYFSKN
jgi:hypothetical protein